MVGLVLSVQIDVGFTRGVQSMERVTLKSDTGATSVIDRINALVFTTESTNEAVFVIAKGSTRAVLADGVMDKDSVKERIDAIVRVTVSVFVTVSVKTTGSMAGANEAMK